MYCMSDKVQFTQYINPFGRQHGGDEETTWSHVARTVSPSISSHDLISFRLRALTLECNWEQAFYSKIDHIPKPIGLISGEDGGQSSFDQKDLKSWEEIDGKTVCATCDQVLPCLSCVVCQRDEYIEYIVIS